MRSYKTFLPLIVAVVVLLGGFRAWVPQFLTTDNLIDLAQQVSVNAILAFGMTLVILIGGIDLSVGAVTALAGVAAVAVIPDVGSGGAILVGLAIGAGVGAINGAFAAWTKMPAFIITLATMMAARGAALRFNENQPLPVPRDAKLFNELGNEYLLGWLPLPVVVMLVVFAGMAILLHSTRFGQHLFAIGGNREAARFTGIRV